MSKSSLPSPRARPEPRHSAPDGDGARLLGRLLSARVRGPPAVAALRTAAARLRALPAAGRRRLHRHRAALRARAAARASGRQARLPARERLRVGRAAGGAARPRAHRQQLRRVGAAQRQPPQLGLRVVAVLLQHRADDHR